MTSRNFVFGASLAGAVLLMAIAGAWLGDPERRQTLAARPGEAVPTEPGAQAVLKRTAPAWPVKPLIAVNPMGPFAPPVPDLLRPRADEPQPVKPQLLEETPPASGAERVALPAPVNPAPAALASAARAPALLRPGRSDPRPQGWTRHAVASPHNPAHLPVIAIVIDDLGIAPARAAAALALPAPMTMAVLPYARDAAKLAVKARAQGHELLLHLPMEAASGRDPGPHALLSAHTPEEFAQNAHWSLARFEGYVGVNNHMGSKLTQDGAAMTLLMTELKRRGLMFLDSRTTKHTLAAGTARAMGVTTLERDVFLDNVVTKQAIRAQLGKAEAAARRSGYAIAIGHPHAQTVDALAEWAADIEARGFKLVPLSAITRIDPSATHVVALPLPGG